MTNRLAGETSPYLLQHATNPVEWFPWGEEALARARTEDRPILLSIGYSACHWCHVMAHESFEDEAVAAVMNRHFINIKVDREERPDLDHIYQTAQQMLTGRAGGWPLTLFLTPAGVPFYGGTYFPKTPRYRLPGFADLCERVAETYQNRRSEIERQNADLLAVLQRETETPGPLPDEGPALALREHLLAVFDPVNGGFGGAPKFPHPTDLAFLLAQSVRRSDQAARQAVLLSLQRMAEGGLNDALGGGFYRYSVDERWEIPHFEKMLYDNAALIPLYADAWALTGDVRWQRVTEAAVGWVLDEMQAPAGGFYSALDADSEGEEGKFYLWDRKAVRALLTVDEWAAAAPCWGLDSTPNFEGLWHLKSDGPADEDTRDLRESARLKLLASRAGRIRPGLDDKVLTSWNALMIRGLSRAARRLGRKDWQQAADRALDFIRRHLWQDGRLLATGKGREARLNAYLDDYAFLLDALLECLQSRFNPQDLDWAIALADALLAHFEDRDQGGFFFTSHDHETLIQRPKPLFDNALPAGNGIAAQALICLGHLLGRNDYLEAAQRTLQAFAGQLQSDPAGRTSLIQALALYHQPPSLVILRGDAQASAHWQTELARHAHPDWLIFAIPATHDLPPALNKPAPAGADEVNAWVCQGVTCQPPITELGLLSKTLRNAGERV